MVPDGEGGDEWILLSTAIARMSELHPAYRSHPGYARRDLENAIRADRAILRGRSTGALDDPPVVITWPVTSRQELDLFHNTLSERRPGPLGGVTLFRDAQIEWTGIARYLRAFAVESRKTAEVWAAPQSDATEVFEAAKEKRARGPQPKRLEATKDAMRTKLRKGDFTRDDLNKMIGKQMAAMFNVSRTTCTEARKQILSELEFVKNTNPDK
jgi:hypothetical protein